MGINYWLEINTQPRGLALLQEASFKLSIRSTILLQAEGDISELLTSVNECSIERRSSLLPGLGAPSTFTFGQDIRHPLAGKSYVAFPNPLSELP